MQSSRFKYLFLLSISAACAPEVPKQVESGFSMAEHSMPFANFALGFDASEMDAELMYRMFGDAACVGSSSPCQLTPGARAFAKKANKAMAGGRCEGFAVMSSLFHGGKLNPVDFGGSTARDLTLEDNTPLQREIAYWFTTQLVPEVSSKQTKSYMANEVMPALAKALAKGATERFRIGIVRKKGKTISGGHALTPISYTSDASEKGVYWLRVYDNNNPDTERLLKIDTLKNRWEFEAAENPARETRLYFGDESNQNPLYLAPVFNRVGQLPCAFCDDADESVVTSSGGAQISLPGFDIGVIDGMLSGGAMPSFSAPLDDQPAEFIVPVPAGALNINITAPSDADFPFATQAVEVQGANFNVSASDMLVSGNDTLEVSSNGTNVAYLNQSHTSLSLKTEVVLPDGRALAVAAVLSGSSSDVKANIDPATGNVSIAAGNADGTQVTMVVTSTDMTGAETTGQLTFVAEGDGGISADTTGWMAGAPLTGTVTNNGSTMTVTNACEDGVTSGMESDVDCGAVCTTKCSVTQACNSAADCESGFCSTAGRCVASSCEDGARSGSETAIDCGGTCGGCAVGQACAQNSDCAGTAACAGNVCTPTFAVGVAVTGLPGGNTLVLHDNGADPLSLGADGTYLFSTRVTGAYDVTVATQPAEATCTVTSGSGTATADVLVQITCVETFALGGALTGLPSGQTVTLQNGAQTLTLSADGTFTFSGRVVGAYAVTVATQPAGASCSVGNDSGVASADVIDITVTCSSGFSIGGNITGIPNAQVVELQNNGGDPLFVPFDGPFTFTLPASTYLVTVATQPTGATCVVTNSSGTATANVINVVVTCSPNAASGTLDTTFNGTGFLTQSLSTNSDFWIDGVMNADGSMVLVGQRDNAGTVEWVVSKVLATGALDTTFGTNGHLTISTGTGIQSTRGVFADGMGYLVVGTLAGAVDRDVGIARVTATGALDTAFATNGLATFDSGGGWDYVEDAARDAMGRIVVVGRSSVGGAGPHDVLVGRLNANGTADVTFGNAGFLLTDSGGDDTGASVAIDAATQDLLVVGTVDGSTRVWRLDSAGLPVFSFGTSGAATIDLSGAAGTQVPYRVVMSGTNVLVAGRADVTTSDFALMQLTSTGAVDTAFGSAGRLLIDRGGHEVAYSVTAAPGGGWYFGGHSGNNLVVGKLSATGVVDTTFATNGFFSAPLANSALAYHLLVDSAQRVVAIGTIRPGASEDLGVVRITP